MVVMRFLQGIPWLDYSSDDAVRWAQHHNKNFRKSVSITDHVQQLVLFTSTAYLLKPYEPRMITNIHHVSTSDGVVWCYLASRMMLYKFGCIWTLKIKEAKQVRHTV